VAAVVGSGRKRSAVLRKEPVQGGHKAQDGQQAYELDEAAPERRIIVAEGQARRCASVNFMTSQVEHKDH
jgi:hypothetical protein